MESIYATWKGIKREEIDWAPTIDEQKCTGCGMCFTSCGRSVFGFNIEKKKAFVKNPLQCMVGCTSCKVWCIFNAISFPDPENIKNIIKIKGVLNLAKKQIYEKLNS